jgi:hypothetical protein
MRENIYQNIDQPLNNPLDIASGSVFKKDRRLILLLILAGIIVVLLITSLVVSLFKKSPRRPVTATPTPTPTIIPPIVNEPNIIPTTYRSQFKTIEDNLKYNPEILPPQIDPQMGL